jgi:hypothetical protein
VCFHPPFGDRLAQALLDPLQGKLRQQPHEGSLGFRRSSWFKGGCAWSESNRPQTLKYAFRLHGGTKAREVHFDQKWLPGRCPVIFMEPAMTEPFASRLSSLHANQSRRALRFACAPLALIAIAAQAADPQDAPSTATAASTASVVTADPLAGIPVVRRAVAAADRLVIPPAAARCSGRTCSR